MLINVISIYLTNSRKSQAFTRASPNITASQPMSKPNVFQGLTQLVPVSVGRHLLAGVSWQAK